MERFIYNLVKDRPWLKDLIKKRYQGFFSLFGRRFQFGDGLLIVRPNAFFGFHDKSPWSDDNSMLLAHKFLGTGNEEETAADPVSIVIYEGREWQSCRAVAKSKAWNWQQGSQLQWKGSNIIFNDFVGGHCVAVEYDLHGNCIRQHPYPVAAVSPCNALLAGFCFESFGQSMPGYGYDFVGGGASSNIPRDSLVIFSEDGDVIADISGKDLPSVEPDADEADSNFVSHVLFSPSGRKVAFMRRIAITGRRLRSALYVYEVETGQTIRIPFKNMVSHYCWLNDDVIFAYANTENGDGYLTYMLSSGRLEFFSDRLGWSDGHPHTDFSGNLVVFDTYPDKYRLQHLSVFDFEKGNLRLLAKLFSPMKFWATKRVDLHPRMRGDGKYICIDCSHTGVRSLATLKVNNDDL